MEHLSHEEGEVADDVDNERFHDADVMREAGDESAEQPEQYADAGGAKHDDEEGREAGDDVDSLNVLNANFTETLEHVVQHLAEQQQ